MYDNLGRCIEYIRISVTDHCNLHCRYCMPKQGRTIPHTDLLSDEEIIRLVRCFSRLGARKIRLTGGEPLTRTGISDLIRSIKAVSGIEKVTLTTNGVLLPSMADNLKSAGLDYINVSLDTLNDETFFYLTQHHGLSFVKAGLLALQKAGFQHTRINCVPLRGINETDIPRLAELARNEEINIRFIELMPIGCAYESGLKRIPIAEVKSSLQTAFGPLKKVHDLERFPGPAEYVQPTGFKGKIGFIDAMEHRFCANCNRLRLTADGFIKLCLHSAQGLDVKTLIRNGITDTALCQSIADIVKQKPAGHMFSAPQANHEDKRYMYQVGG